MFDNFFGWNAQTPLLEGWRRRGIKNSIPTSQTAKNKFDFFGPFHQKDPSEDGIHHFISSLTHQKWHGHVGFSLSCGSPGGMLAWPHYLQLGYLWNHSMASYASSLAADGRGGCSTQCGDVSWFRTAGVLRHQFARGAMAVLLFWGERIRKLSDGTFKISDGNGTSFLKQLSIFLGSTVVLEG